MGIFDSLTGAAQRGDIWKGVGEATDVMKSYTNAANRDLRTGYNVANNTLNTGMATGAANLRSGAARARSDVNAGTNSALASLRGGNATVQPYYQQGTAANTMYGNALGINGAAAREQTQGTYMSDPIMQGLMNQANENVLKRYNASGLANSGASRAAILQNQYNNYGGWLDRLNGQGQMGFQAAGQMNQNAANMANLQAARGNALSGISERLGQGQADNSYRYRTQTAGNRVNLGRETAQNTLNLGNSRADMITGARTAAANTRGMGWQNAFNMLGSGLNMATGISNAGGLSKIAGGLF